MPAPPLLTTVVLAVADPDVRAATVRAIEAASDLELIGTAATDDEVLTLVRATVPDVVLLGTDVVGPALGSVCATLTAALPAVRVVVVAPEAEASYAAVVAGAIGCIRPDQLAPDAVDAIRRVAWGEGLLTADWARAILADLGDRAVDNAEAGPLGRPGLTVTELEVLRRTTGGATAEAIAALHGVTERDVNRNAAHAMVKAARLHQDRDLADPT